MTRPLDSDRLGKKRPRPLFGTVRRCGDHSQSLYLRLKGWDFVVDWRHDPATDNYDARPTLRSYLVQVKMDL